MTFEKIIGAIIAQRKQQATERRHNNILLRTAGEIIWLNIVKGFSDNDILPSGGGQNGSELGSLLPDPWGFLSEIFLGKILTEI